MARNAGRNEQRVAAICDAEQIKGDQEAQFVKEDPALELRDRAREAGAAWQVLRAAARAHGSAVESGRPVERIEQSVQDRPVAVEPRLAQPPRGGVGVRVVEAAVLFAVAAYFFAGLVGTFIL